MTERPEGPFSQFGRVGGSQRRSDPQESRWEVPATIISCKVNIEVRIRNVTTPPAQPACPSADVSCQAHARALWPWGAGAKPGGCRIAYMFLGDALQHNVKAQRLRWRLSADLLFVF